MSGWKRRNRKAIFFRGCEETDHSSFPLKPAGIPVVLLLSVIKYQLECGMLLISTFVCLTISSFISKFLSCYSPFFLYIHFMSQSESFNHTHTFSLCCTTSIVFFDTWNSCYFLRERRTIHSHSYASTELNCIWRYSVFIKNTTRKLQKSKNEESVSLTKTDHEMVLYWW